MPGNRGETGPMRPETAGLSVASRLVPERPARSSAGSGVVGDRQCLCHLARSRPSHLFIERLCHACRVKYAVGHTTFPEFGLAQFHQHSSQPSPPVRGLDEDVQDITALVLRRMRRMQRQSIIVAPMPATEAPASSTIPKIASIDFRRGSTQTPESRGHRRQSMVPPLGVFDARNISSRWRRTRSRSRGLDGPRRRHRRDSL